MNIEIGLHLVGTILGTGVVLIVLVLATARKTTKAEALRASWEAWREVSMRCLEKGQAPPPPPGEHGHKR